MDKLIVLIIFRFFMHTLLITGGVFLKKIKKFFKCILNDLTIYRKRVNMQTSKAINGYFPFVLEDSND